MSDEVNPYTPKPNYKRRGEHRIRLLVSYDGTDFAGWQRQTNASSVQQILEESIGKLIGEQVVIQGAGRTDSGVHAHGQVAHFDMNRDPNSVNFILGLRQHLPPTIVVKEAFHAPGDFHALASCVKKTYQYLVLNREYPSALRFRYTYWRRFPLDIDYLNEATQFLLGKQDFKAFQSTGTEVQSTVREIFEAGWRMRDDDTVEFSITGDGFLKQMVRAIVGTLIELNQEKESPKRIREILETLDRRKAGPTAPPQGLYLTRVYYPQTLDNQCRKL